MGLFSSKKVTIVGTSVNRVIEDKLLPNSIKTGLIRGIFTDTGIPENMMDELLQSIGIKADRMYDYAKKSYMYGLPSGTHHSAAEGREELEAILTNIEGSPVLVNYSRYGPPNILHQGWMLVQAYGGYNAKTNELTNLSHQKGFPVYLEDMVVTVPSLASYTPEALEQWGSPPSAGYTPTRSFQSGTAPQGLLSNFTPVTEDPSVPEGVRITWVWEEPFERWEVDHLVKGKNLMRETVHFPTNPLDITKEYFQVKYSVRDQEKYWTYLIGSGQFPGLDKIHETPPAKAGEYFPWTYFRFDKTPENSDKNSATYKAGKKMSKYLGMDYNAVIDAIHENPDIKDVEQAMCIFAIPANSQDPVDLEYLWKYFDRWYYEGEYQFRTEEQAYATINIDKPEEGLDLLRSAIVIQDKRFKMALSNGGIYKKRNGGNIGGPKGTIKVQRATKKIKVPYINGASGTPVEDFYEYPVDVHIYSKQITESIYDTIEIVNLKMMYHIWKEYAATADDEADALLIPIDRTLVDKLSLPKKEILYSRSLHFVFNARVIQKIKWYQQEWFQIFMIIVAIVITIVTYGAGSELLAGVIAGSTAAINTLITIIIINLAINIAFGFVMKFVAKELGMEAAIVLAIVAIAVGGYYDIGPAAGIAGAPFADQLLQVASGLMSVADQLFSALSSGIAEQFKDFTNFAEDKWNSLEEVNNLLDQPNKWLAPVVIFGETPDDYYNRTVHSGNVGVLGISAIGNYVENALTLPKLYETLEEFKYE